ncbi:MAG: twin-arginine translocase TatA/TatE family subunit [Stappiaceae bacterium]
MGISIWQILIIAVVVVLLFGRGKISELMGDVAKGIKSFKKGLNEDELDTAQTENGQTIDHKASETVTVNKTEDQSKAS